MGKYTDKAERLAAKVPKASLAEKVRKLGVRADKDIANLNSLLSQANDQIDRLNAQIEACTVRIEALENSLAGTQDALAAALEEIERLKNPPTEPEPVPVGSPVGMCISTNPGESYQAALKRRDDLYNNNEWPVRKFFPGLPSWSASGIPKGRDLQVSFKAEPKDILSGSLDSVMLAWFQTAPNDVMIYWTYFHEPEDQIEGKSQPHFTAKEFCDAWVHLKELADRVNKPNLKATLCLMGWSLTKESGRNWLDYYPGDDVIDVLSWDQYNSAVKDGKYADPATVFGPCIATSKARKKPFIFAEWGSKLAAGDNGSGRAAWITKTVDYFEKNGAIMSTYFDSSVGGEYRLLDVPSQDAMRVAINR